MNLSQQLPLGRCNVIGGGNGPIRYERKGPTAVQIQMLCASNKRKKVFAFPPMTQTSDFPMHGPPSSAVCTCPLPFRVLDHKFVATNTSTASWHSHQRPDFFFEYGVPPWPRGTSRLQPWCLCTHTPLGARNFGIRSTARLSSAIVSNFVHGFFLITNKNHFILFSSNPRRTLNNLASTRH